MSSRGITDIILNGEAFELHPTFSNLDKLETVLNKGAIGFLRQDLSSGAFKTGDVVSIIQVCAVPANGRKFPSWWNRDGPRQLNYCERRLPGRRVDLHLFSV